MSRGMIPQKPIVMVTENGDEAAITAVDQKADQAQAMAANARQMVLNRDPRLTAVEQNTADLQQLATDYQARLAESLAERAALKASVASLATGIHDEAENRATIDASQQAAITGLSARLDNIQLTPGPDGKPGRDGADGKPGTDGRPGADGKSAYHLAREAGYGGTQTQWLASLKGEAGKDGAPGTAGKDFDPTVATALANRLTALEGSRTLAYGMASTPVLALLATTDVTITLSRTMPDTNYVIELGKSSNLRDDMITLKTKTTTTVVYTVRAVIALGAGTLAVITRY